MVSWPGTAATVSCMFTLRSRSVTGLTQVSPRFPDARQRAAPAEHNAPLILADDLEPEHPGHPIPPALAPAGSPDPAWRPRHTRPRRPVIESRSTAALLHSGQRADSLREKRQEIPRECPDTQARAG